MVNLHKKEYFSFVFNNQFLLAQSAGAAEYTDCISAEG